MDRERSRSLMEEEEGAHTFGMQAPYAPIRWGEPAPKKATRYQKTVIVAAACVGAVLSAVSIFELLF